jgi:hypothetical protein
LINNQSELLSFIENHHDISSEEVHQVHMQSDQHKWSEDNRESHFNRLLVEYRLKRWVYGEIALKYLNSVKMANTDWVRFICGQTR